ncbi:hypothetical protein ACH4TV_16400 [Streptomyces sp. NPDC020898]|uniref:hypothetical protein n=1 Tax=Streptomyces sp. NPDC020898 TaxID=3365101 RepID=UPI0037A1CD64
MSQSHTVAAPERGAPRSRTQHRLSKPFLLVLQLLLATLVATGAFVTTTGSASAQNETGASLNQGQLPGVVYRGDSRGPNDIFANGFWSRGTNYDLQAHVHGDRAHNSGYISTSGLQSEAERFARSQGVTNLDAAARQPRCQGAGWTIGQSIPVVGWLITSHCAHAVVEARTFVYTINPQFANVILHVPEQLRGNPDMYRAYRSQDEWAFFRRIPPEAITGVHVYHMTARAAGSLLQLQSLTFQHERWVPNPNYNRNFHYNPVSDPGANLDWNTGLNIPPIQANEYNRGCSAAQRCRGGNG